MNRAKVLVVDDDQDTLNLLDVVLSNAGYEMMRAGNGAEAIQRLENELPDLVLCDILMPIMDGYDTLLQIRSNTRTSKLPVVMLSALGQEKDVRAAMKAGANGYIVKPFSLRQLLAEIKTYISAPS